MNNRGGILVTGAGGFLGSCIANYLITQGYKVRCTARETGRQEFKDFQALDLVEDELPSALFGGVQVVIHTAGIAHRPAGSDQSDFMANVKMTRRLAESALSAGVGHFILFSSVSVYGATEDETRLIDEDTVCNPLNPYARSKYDSELELLSVAGKGAMRVTILRLATVHGEGDPGNLNRLLRVIKNYLFLMPGSGANFKTLIYKKDVARACEVLIREPGKQVEIFNLATEKLKVREIVETMYRALGRRVPILCIPDICLQLILRITSCMPVRMAAQIADSLRKWLRNEQFSADKFSQQFGFQAETSFLQSIKKQLESP